jgi:hypothetical protein
MIADWRVKGFYVLFSFVFFVSLLSLTIHGVPYTASSRHPERSLGIDNEGEVEGSVLRKYYLLLSLCTFALMQKYQKIKSKTLLCFILPMNVLSTKSTPLLSMDSLSVVNWYSTLLSYSSHGFALCFRRVSDSCIFYTLFPHPLPVHQKHCMVIREQNMIEK